MRMVGFHAVDSVQLLRKIFAEIEIVLKNKKETLNEIPSAWLSPPIQIFIIGPSVLTFGFVHYRV